LVDRCAIPHGNITAKGRRARLSYRSSPEICDWEYLSELESERTILARGRFGMKNVGKVQSLVWGENASAYLFTTCCDREYFNKVSSGEVRNFQD